MRYACPAMLIALAGAAVLINMFIPDRQARERNEVLAELR